MCSRSVDDPQHLTRNRIALGLRTLDSRAWRRPGKAVAEQGPCSYRGEKGARDTSLAPISSHSIYLITIEALAVNLCLIVISFTRGYHSEDGGSQSLVGLSSLCVSDFEGLARSLQPSLFYSWSGTFASVTNQRQLRER